jgi:hypothetical protein
MAIAMSNAARREKEGEALRIATAAEKIQARRPLKRPTRRSGRPRRPVMPVKKPLRRQTS